MVPLLSLLLIVFISYSDPYLVQFLLYHCFPAAHICPPWVTDFSPGLWGFIPIPSKPPTITYAVPHLYRQEDVKGAAGMASWLPFMSIRSIYCPIFSLSFNGRIAFCWKLLSREDIFKCTVVRVEFLRE